MIMNIPSQTPYDRLRYVLDRIQAACDRSHRSFSDVTLVGVTKGHVFDDIVPFLDLSSLLDVGESYLQESEKKIPLISDHNPSIRKHFIGHLQSNKAKKVLQLFDTIHSVDSLNLIQELDKRCSQLLDSDQLKYSKFPIFIEVNLSGDPNKAGCKPEETVELVEKIVDQTEHLNTIGLMTISPLEMVAESPLHEFFAHLRTMKEEIEESFPSCAELSMGMSDDFEIAIEEGSTFVRIGTLLFGPRQY